MAIGIDPKIDFAFKRLLGSNNHPAITLSFLNAILAGDPMIASVEILNPIKDKEFQDDKLAILDVKATDDHGRLLNIEMQTSLPGELTNRLAYYVAAQYVQQLKEGDTYGLLKPSIGISVLDGSLFPGRPEIHLDFRLRSHQPELTFSDVLQLHLLELPKYTPPSDNRQITDPIEMWAFFFQRAAYLTRRQLVERLADPVFDEAAGVLEMIARTPEERELYEARLKLQRDEQSRIEAARDHGRMMGRIQLLQQLLGLPESPDATFEGQTLDQLAALEDDLQRQLRQRG